MQNLLIMIKRAARRTILPVARPVWRRIYPRVARYSDLMKLSAAWHQHLPTFVNAAATVSAVAREQARMKREYDSAIAELRSAIGQLRQDTGLHATARIAASDKVQRARAQGLRLAISRLPVEGYLTVDPVDAPGVDIVAQPDSLPFAPGELAEIFCPRGLERFGPRDFEHKLLRHWAQLLRPGGTLRVVATDARALTQAAARGELPFDALRDVLFGVADDHEPRSNMFTAESLAAALRAAGMADVQVVAEGRRRGTAYECELVAHVPAR